MANVGPIYYPDTATPFNFNTVLASMASSINDAYAPYTSDTGWVNCTLASDINRQGSLLPAVRRIGKVVYARWGISGAGLTANTTKHAFTVPSGFRPTNAKYFQIAGSSGATSAMSDVNANGVVNVRTSATVAVYYIWDNCSWTVD